MNKKMKILAVGAIVIMLASTIAMFQIINAQYMEQPHKTIRVACVGDSITAGSAYPAKLQFLLGTNYLVGNFGASGSAVSLNSKKPYMNESVFQQAEDFQPDVVVIMLGTNDASLSLSQYDESFETDYTTLVSSFQDLPGNQQIFAVNSPPIFTNNNPDYNNTILSNNVLPHIDNVANNLNLTTVDVYSAFGNHANYFMDGVHPNPDGATLIASEVYIAIIGQENPSP